MRMNCFARRMILKRKIVPLFCTLCLALAGSTHAGNGYLSTNDPVVVVGAAQITNAYGNAYRIVSDISYLGEEYPEKADLYLPLLGDGPFPAVLHIHGGGWGGGDKADPVQVIDAGSLAVNGYAVLSINYLLNTTEQKAWPRNVYDCKTALRFMRAYAEELQIDPERIAVTGKSAGGHLALVTGLGRDVDFLNEGGFFRNQPVNVSAIINQYGITDIRTNNWKNGLLGSEATNTFFLDIASPVVLVESNSPPVLTLHGDADTTVYFSHAQDLKNVLDRTEVANTLIRVDGGGHAFAISTHPFNNQTNLVPPVVEFLDRHLENGDVLPHRATLIHRYVFSNSVVDVAGSIAAQVSVAGTYMEPPEFASDSPSGACGPAQALSVGMNQGTKKSVVTISKNILRDQGTLVFWFRPRTVAASRYICFAPSLANGFSLIQRNSMQMFANAVGSDSSSSTLNLSGGETDWHFCALSWSKTTGTARIYIDGDWIEKSFEPQNWNPQNLILGGYSSADTSGNLANQYDGLIYDVQVYDGVLGHDSIRWLREHPGQTTAGVISNGTPFSWLDQYRSNLVTIADYEKAALTDSDGDGFAAWSEYRAGTDPENSGSRFELRQTGLIFGSGWGFEWPSREGAIYDLFVTEDLASNQWRPVAAEIQGRPTSTSFTVAVDRASAFFKLKLH